MAEKMNEIAHDIIPTQDPSSQNKNVVGDLLTSLENIKIDHHKSK